MIQYEAVFKRVDEVVFRRRACVANDADLTATLLETITELAARGHLNNDLAGTTIEVRLSPTS